MKIVYSKSFLKAHKKQDEKIRIAFKKRLTLFIADRTNVLLHDEKLIGEWRGYRSFNVTGDYRAIYKENDDDIIIVFIGKHAQIYRSMS